VATIRAVLFDLGNTLIHYGNLWEEGVWREGMGRLRDWLEARQVVGLPARDAFIDQIIARLQEMEGDFNQPIVPLGERLEQIFCEEGLKVPTDWLGEAIDVLLSPMLERSRLDPQAHQVLSAIQARGYKLGAVSNLPWGAPSHIWRKELERFGLARYFIQVSFCVDVGFRKPHPDIFTACTQALEVSPEETLFVGDSQRADIRGAKALGMMTALRRNSYFVYDDGIEADWEIDTLGELLELLPERAEDAKR
jgi:HAD superfamily hydrolase (TIGR01509 family)